MLSQVWNLGQNGEKHYQHIFWRRNFQQQWALFLSCAIFTLEVWWLKLTTSRQPLSCIPVIMPLLSFRVSFTTALQHADPAHLWRFLVSCTSHCKAIKIAVFCFCNKCPSVQFWLALAHMYVLYFWSYLYFKFFIIWKTGNQLKICIVHLLAEKRTYWLLICHGFELNM